MRKCGPAYFLIFFLTTCCVVSAVQMEISQERRTFRSEEAKRLSSKRQELSPVRSFERIARYYIKNKKPEKALEIYIFGLNHQPYNTNLLKGLLKTATGLSKFRLARPYAAHYLEIAPESNEAFHYYKLIEDELNKSVREKEQKAQAEFNAPEPSTGKGELSESVTATGNTSGVSTNTQSSESSSTESSPSFTMEEQMKGLKILSAIAAAVRVYNLRNKDEPMEELSLEKLRETGILPKGLKLNNFENLLSLDSGEPSIKGMGKWSVVKEKLDPIKDKMNKVRLYTLNGEYYHAINVIDELSTSYPLLAEGMYRRLVTVISSKGDEGTKTVATELINKFKDKPRPLFELTMVYYKLGNFEEAKITADHLIDAYKETHWAKLAEEVKKLMDSKISYNLMSDLTAAREKLLSKQTKYETKP